MNNDLVKSTIEILSAYSRKWAEINALNHIWFYMNFGFEYDSNEKISTNLEKMYHAAPMFFSISRIAIERTSRIELIRLFEGDDKASIKYLRKYLESVSEILFDEQVQISALEVLNKNLHIDLQAHIKTIDSLKEIRHKHLAHSDLDIYLNPSDLYKKNKIKIDNIFILIKIIGDYLDRVSELFNTPGCPKYNEIMDIQSLEMYFIENNRGMELI